MMVVHLKPLGIKFFRALPKDESSWARCDLVDGRPCTPDWKPFEIDITASGSRRGAQKGDFPSLLAHAPLMSARARTILGGLLEKDGEFLPVHAKRETYFIFNATKVIDVLDAEQSEVTRFKSNGKIMTIDRYAFHADLIPRQINAFRIPSIRYSEVFYSEAVAEAVKSSVLRGVEVRELWRSY